jgi:hypothetical protein
MGIIGTWNFLTIDDSFEVRSRFEADRFPYLNDRFPGRMLDVPIGNSLVEGSDVNGKPEVVIGVSGPGMCDDLRWLHYVPVFVAPFAVEAQLFGPGT